MGSGDESVYDDGKTCHHLGKEVESLILPCLAVCLSGFPLCHVTSLTLPSVVKNPAFNCGGADSRTPVVVNFRYHPCGALATTLKPTFAGSDGEPRLMQDVHKCPSDMQK